MKPVYDRIGVGYEGCRRTEPSWERAIHDAIGRGSVVNVGAGTGSYEPDSTVLAIEPSATMIAQRPPDAATVVRGVAEMLPLPARTVDVALAVLTVHHWADSRAGLRELQRVSTRQVVVTWDPVISADYWLITDYLPEMAGHESRLVTLPQIVDALDVVDIIDLPVPADCADGFMAAYWRRPEAYLDPAVRASISSLVLLQQDRVEMAMGQLAADIDSGVWASRNAQTLEMTELDRGYRLVIAGH